MNEICPVCKQWESVRPANKDHSENIDHKRFYCWYCDLFFNE